MADRDINSIEQIAGAAPEPAAQPPVARPAPEPVLVDVNYPEPTPLTVILRDVSRWSGQSFVMEPTVNARIQIFAPRRQTVADAYELFLASLSVINLRAVQVGKVVKIVPVTMLVAV